MRIYISVMQIGYINEQKRKEPVLMAAGKYMVAGNYAVAKEKVALVEHFVDYLMFLWWVFAGFAWLSSLTQVEGEVTQAVLFLLGFVAINYIVGLPFELYQKFKIDKEFRFNKMTPKMFIVDQLKSAVLFVVIGGALFALLAWIITTFEMWWLWGFVAMFSVAVLANVLMPWFMGLFNKFTPLKRESLKERSPSLWRKRGLRVMASL